MRKTNFLIHKSLYKPCFLAFLAYIVLGVGVPESQAQFKWGKNIKGDIGANPSVASDGDGTVVGVYAAYEEVHPGGNGGVRLWYHVGQYNSAKQTIDWGTGVNYDTGSTPFVAATNCAVRYGGNKKTPALLCTPGVVEVHQGGGGWVSHDSDMWYRVGLVNGPTKSPIDWGPSPKGKKYDAGTVQSVAIAGDGSTVVEMHTTFGGNQMWYRVGQVNWTKHKIKWGPNRKYKVGGTGSVAAAPSGSTVLEVHAGGTRLWYHVGQINASTQTITGFGSPSTSYDKSGSVNLPDVAISGCGALVEVHIGTTPVPGPTVAPLFYRLGTLAGSTVTWGSSISYGKEGAQYSTTDDRVQVASGSDGVVIEAHLEPSSSDKYRVCYHVGQGLCPPPPPIK